MKISFAKSSSSLFFLLNRRWSGISNLSNNSEENINPSDFYVSEAYVNQGPSMKRFRPAAMGRATPILKRSSHLTIKLNNKKN